MDGKVSQAKSENDGSLENQKKPLSRSSTGDGDEWVLVNSLGSEIEDASCQAQNNDEVGTTADFNAPMVDDAVSMSIDLKPLASANVYCLAAQEPEKKESDEEKEKENKNSEPDVPTVEVSTTADLSAPTAVSDVTDNGISDTFSRVEGHTIERNESSETSSQISILDHDDLSKSVEEKPSSMESSVSTDSGGYEVVNALLLRADQTSEPDVANETAPVTSDDELPITFVQSCSDRVRHYFHSYNLALNWKLSLLVVVASAAVLGLGIGHFIGSTHVWLTRQNQVQQRQEEQIQMLQTRLVDCWNNLQKEQAELDDEVSTSNGCGNGFCQLHEKPSCPTTGDFETRLEGCSKMLENCQNNLNAVEEENKKRSKNMVKAFKDLRLLRENLKQVHATYEKLSALLMAEREHLRDEDGEVDSGNSKKIEEMTKKLKESELREEKLINQEVELRRMLNHLESTVAALNAELTRMKSKSSGRKDQEKCKAKNQKEAGGEDETTSEDDDAFNFDFNWNRFSDLLQQLKETTKLDQVVDSYLDLFKDLKLPEINVSRLWLDQLPGSIEKMAKNLKQGLDEKVQEFEHTLYETNWDEYVQKAKDVTKDVTSRVGETVGTLWKKAKDLSDHVREQHGEQGEKIFNDIKSTVEKAAEVFDQRWEQATRFWRDVVGSRDAEEQEDEAEEEAPDDGKDEVWVYHEPVNEDEPIDSEEAIGESSGWNRDDVEENKGERTDDWTWIKPSVEIIPEPTDETKYDTVDAAREVKQLRDALKSSSVFSFYVTDEFADHYFRRLKLVGKALSQNENDQSAWWMCQKLWWIRHSFAYGRQCSDKLMSWQRHVRVDVDVRQNLIDQTPQLKSLIKKFANDEETQKIQDGANWVFEWAKNRQEMRREDEQRKKKDGWIYERWRSRDEMRHQEEVSPSKWLFRRGKEREKKRDDDQGNYWQHRRRTNSGSKESLKKPPYAPRHRR